MGISGKYLLLFLLSSLSCYFVTGHQSGAHAGGTAIKHSLIPNTVTGRRKARLPFGTPGFRSKSLLNVGNLQTFNRPEGTESVIINTNKPGSGTQYGRTFGQYGSYKKHKSWQNAVAEDRQRHLKLPEDLKVKFPWIMHQLHTPSIHGFGLNGFWNSYALPEGTPDVSGLGLPKFEQGQLKQR